MKILIAAPPKSPLVQRTIQKLKEHGIECAVASFDAEADFYPCRSFSLGRLTGYTDYFKFWKILNILNEYKPDVIHAHVLNHYGLTCSFLDYPLLVTMWGSDVMLAPNVGGWKRYIYKVINYFVIKRADGLHTSSAHVAEEASHQCKEARGKTRIFYWGLRLSSPEKEEKTQILRRLDDKYNIRSKKYFIFNRGLGYAYNPGLVANVINALIESNKFDKNIIVLKAYSTDEEVDSFFKKVDKSKLIFISEILTEKELHELYKFSVAHFSLSLSDALGGGVIEPALCGSYPILSNIPPYLNYSENNTAYILNTNDPNGIHHLVQYLLSIRPDCPPCVDSAYNDNRIISNTIEMYKKIAHGTP